jgi:hypothetical protein
MRRHVKREPFYEVIGIFGKGAHIAGADIQEMFGIACAISESASEFSCAFDQYDGGGGIGPENVKCDERAAEARTGYRDFQCFSQ